MPIKIDDRIDALFASIERSFDDGGDRESAVRTAVRTIQNEIIWLYEEIDRLKRKQKSIVRDNYFETRAAS